MIFEIMTDVNSHVIANAKFNGTIVKSIFDTGSPSTCLDLSLYNRMDPRIRPVLIPLEGPSNMVAANNLGIECAGVAMFEVALGCLSIKVPVHIIPGLSGCGCLIGQDVVKPLNLVAHNGKIYNFSRLVEKLGKNVVENCRPETDEDNKVKVITVRAVKIPKNSMRYVQVKLANKVLTKDKGTVGVIVPTVRDQKPDGKIPAPIYHDFVDEIFTIPVYNYHSTVMELKKFSHVADCELDYQFSKGDVDPFASMSKEATIETISTILIGKYQPTQENIEEAIRKFQLDKCEGLSQPELKRLETILRNYIDVVSTCESDVGLCDLYPFTINTQEGARPPKVSPSRIPVAYEEEVRAAIQKLLDTKKIVPSNSEYTARIVIVVKDGKKRICVDYRALNAITIADSFPLPDARDLRRSLAGAKYFIVLDLKTGFNQIILDPFTAYKTGFVVPWGHYQYTVLPFGPKNGPGHFQRAITDILGDLVGTKCLVFIDDIMIYAESKEQLFQNLEAVLSRLRKSGMKIGPEKCQLFREKVDYLGHEISAAGIRPRKSKVEAILRLPTPTEPKGVMHFLCVAGYFHEYIPNFASIAEPLNKLKNLRSNKSPAWQWTEVEDKAFQELKRILASEIILRCPTKDGLFVLDTDASLTQYGACLQQWQWDDERQCYRLFVIAYGSKTLNEKSPARNYSATEREMGAIMEFTWQYRHYLLGRRFILRTDHSSLQWLYNFQDPQGKIARWILKLQQFDMIVLYRPGKEHMHADALSRMPELKSLDSMTDLEKFWMERADTLCLNGVYEDRTKKGDNGSSVHFEPKVVQQKVQINTIHWPTRIEYEWADQQNAEAPILFFKRWKKTEQPMLPDVPSHFSNEIELEYMMKNSSEFVVVDDVLCRTVQNKETKERETFIYVPKKVRNLLVLDCHTKNHRTAQIAYEELKERYWWPNMQTEINRIVTACPNCQKVKIVTGAHRATMQTFEFEQPFDYLAMDIVGPVPTSTAGNKYVLTIIDMATRWIELVPLRTIDAPTVARAFFMEWCCRYGRPKQMLTDQGSNFESKLFAAFCRILSISKKRTTAYRPQTNGRCERANGMMKQMVSLLGHRYRRDWDLVLPYAAYAIRQSINTTTGFSPAELVFGRSGPTSLLANDVEIVMEHEKKMPKSSIQWLKQLKQQLCRVNKEAHVNAEKHQQIYKRQYDKHCLDRNFKVGDKVLLFRNVITGDKFIPVYEGPYQIFDTVDRSKVNFKVVKVDDPSVTRTEHVDSFKRYIEPELNANGTELDYGTDMAKGMVDISREKRTLRKKEHSPGHYKRVVDNKE